MNDRKNIQDEIDKTLNVINKVNKVDADPFFYTRLSAKLETKNQVGLNWFFESPILRPVLVSLVVILNVLSVLYFANSSPSELTAEEIAEQFNQEYYITQSTDSYLVTNEDN